MERGVVTENHFSGITKSQVGEYNDILKQLIDHGKHKNEYTMSISIKLQAFLKTESVFTVLFICCQTIQAVL